MRGAPIQRWRTWLLVILSLGLAGTLCELLLLGHYEDRWQLAPLVLNSVLLVCIGWYLVSDAPHPVTGIKWLSVLSCVSAAAGIYFHLVANIEWELETTPEMQGVALFREVITGALPLLAPGAMLQLGLIGILWSWKHPRIVGPHQPDTLTPEHTV